MLGPCARVQGPPSEWKGLDMSAIDSVMMFWDMMSTDEKKELILRIGERAMQDGIVDAKMIAGQKKRRSTKPFWMKTVEGVDPSKKGMFRVEGNWVNNVQRDVAEGNMVIVGTREPRHYWVGRRVDGAKMDIANGLVVEDIAHVTDADSFAGIEKEIEKALAA